MSDISDDLLEKITREGLQMAVEAHSASFIVINAQLNMLADAAGVDISNPTLTPVENANREKMLKSVGERLLNIMNYTAEAAGEGPLSPAEGLKLLGSMTEEIWPKGSVTGTREDSPSPADRVVAAIAKSQGDDVEVLDHTVPANLNDAEADALIEAVETAEPKMLEDIRREQAQIAEEPLFKSSRPEPVDETVSEELQPFAFTAHVYSQEFLEAEMEDESVRAQTWQDIIEFYTDQTRRAVSEGILSQALGARVAEEFVRPQDQTSVSPLPIPEPGEISQGIAQCAANGDEEIKITGLTTEQEVAEALLVSFMVSAARFLNATNKYLLEDRLRELGMVT